MKIWELVEQTVGDLATTQITPEEELEYGFRYGDPQQYVQNMLSQLPDSSFIRPLFHQGALIGIVSRPPRDARSIQEFLTQQGYDVGNIDGVWGPATRRATTEFLKAYRVENPSMADTLRGNLR